MTTYFPDDFLAKDFADEVRADTLCKAFLKEFHQFYLLKERQLPPLEAGALAAGTDYLLRDFIMDHCRESPLHLTGHRVRQFGGNWYIVKNLEPNLPELQRSLRGIALLAAFCSQREMMTPEQAQDIRTAAEDTDWYQSRLDSFQDLEGDGYFAWEEACTLADVGKVR